MGNLIVVLSEWLVDNVLLIVWTQFLLSKMGKVNRGGDGIHFGKVGGLDFFDPDRWLEAIFGEVKLLGEEFLLTTAVGRTVAFVLVVKIDVWFQFQ